MTKIYNTTTGKATDISILLNGIHCEGDILGNMDITGNGTGIYRVADDGPSKADEAEADDAGCNYYGDSEAVTWWVDYVNGYNATLSDITDIRSEITFSEKSDEEISESLSIDYSKHNTATGAIITWLTDNDVDHDAERGAFVEKLAELRAAL